MYKPEGLKISETEYLKPKNDIPYTVKIFFFVLEFAFGMNFGFTKCFSAPIQPKARIVSVLVSLIVLSILCMPVVHISTYGFNHWFSIIAVQYALLFIVLNVTKYDVYNFIQDITSFGEDITQLSKEIIGVAAFLYSAVIFSIKFGIGIALCSSTRGEECSNVYYISYYVYGPMSLSLDIISVIFLLIYYYIYCCVRKLRATAGKSGPDVENIQKFYLKLADCFDKIMPLYDKLMAVELVFEMPKLMAMVYWMLSLIKSQATWVQISTEGIYAGHVFIRILFPAILTEMVNHEVQCTTRTLHHQLMQQQDAVKSAKLLGLLRYMRAVRLQHRICRVVPVDMRLPLSVLSLSVTYLIVIVQFTHLYD